MTPYDATGKIPEKWQNWDPWFDKRTNSQTLWCHWENPRKMTPSRSEVPHGQRQVLVDIIRANFNHDASQHFLGLCAWLNDIMRCRNADIYDFIVTYITTIKVRSSLWFFFFYNFCTIKDLCQEWITVQMSLILDFNQNKECTKKFMSSLFLSFIWQLQFTSESYPSSLSIISKSCLWNRKLLI